MDQSSGDILIALGATIQNEFDELLPLSGSNSPNNVSRPTIKPTRRKAAVKAASIPITESDSPVPEASAKEPFRPKACQSCKNSHVACGYDRPCNRCIRAGKADSCVDATPKKRGRPSNESRLLDALEGITRPPKRSRKASLNKKPSKEDEKKRKDLERQLTEILNDVPTPTSTNSSLPPDPISPPESNDVTSTKFNCLTPTTCCSGDSFFHEPASYIPPVAVKSDDDDFTGEDIFNFLTEDVQMGGGWDNHMTDDSKTTTTTSCEEQSNNESTIAFCSSSVAAMAPPALSNDMDISTSTFDSIFNGMSTVQLSVEDELLLDNLVNQSNFVASAIEAAEPEKQSSFANQSLEGFDVEGDDLDALLQFIGADI
ncbi:UNVERIFIED_CONTAM: hypothetical protein HDU68_009016 [Siphonaria sp. JEL0065]|nr:hypothetical protein HDU68_009016 [Siphonaria sp. JEL0065]